jgi:peptide/nickel transport system permease protein
MTKVFPFLRFLLILWIVVTLVFVSLRLAPGDPAIVLLGPTAGRPDTAERLAEIRSRYGLDRPIIVQYGIYISDILTGDLGNSNRSNRSVVLLIKTAAPVTISLIVLSMAMAIPIAIYLGMTAAQRRGRIYDRAVRTFATLAMAMPSFWVGLLLLNFFAVKMSWLPASGYLNLSNSPIGYLSHMALPVVTLALYLIGTLTRFVYTETADTLEQDYILISRAMGIKPRNILFRFAARNSLTPMIIVLGFEIGTLIGGAVIVEEVFGLPGLGRLLLNAVLGRDYPVVQGTVLVITVAVIILNILAELIYRRLNPQANA